MKKTRRHILCATVATAALALLAAAPAGARTIIETRNLTQTDLSDLVDAVKEKDVVFVGESHGNRDHHAAQLSVIDGLSRGGDRITIGLEQFGTGYQWALDAWIAGMMTETELLPIFVKNWGGTLWGMYRPIFLYARDNGIPMLGVNIDRRLVGKVSRDGFGSLPEGSVPGVTKVSCDASERYQQEIRNTLTGHMRSLDYRNFCEAQVLWDSAMAWNIIDYLAGNPDRTVVVLAGQYHSWNHGIPERIRRQSALSTSVILPSSGGSNLGYDLTEKEADFVWWIDGAAN